MPRSIITLRALPGLVSLLLTLHQHAQPRAYVFRNVTAELDPVSESLNARRFASHFQNFARATKESLQRHDATRGLPEGRLAARAADLVKAELWKFVQQVGNREEGFLGLAQVLYEYGYANTGGSYEFYNYDKTSSSESVVGRTRTDQEDEQEGPSSDSVRAYMFPLLAAEKFAIAFDRCRLNPGNAEGVAVRKCAAVAEPDGSVVVAQDANSASLCGGAAEAEQAAAEVDVAPAPAVTECRQRGLLAAMLYATSGPWVRGFAGSSHMIGIPVADRGFSAVERSYMKKAVKILDKLEKNLGLGEDDAGKNQLRRQMGVVRAGVVAKLGDQMESEGAYGYAAAADHVDAADGATLGEAGVTSMRRAGDVGAGSKTGSTGTPARGTAAAETGVWKRLLGEIRTAFRLSGGSRESSGHEEFSALVADKLRGAQVCVDASGRRKTEWDGREQEQVRVEVLAVPPDGVERPRVSWTSSDYQGSSLSTEPPNRMIGKQAVYIVLSEAETNSNLGELDSAISFPLQKAVYRGAAGDEQGFFGFEESLPHCVQNESTKDPLFMLRITGCE
eukprot:g439.t1